MDNRTRIEGTAEAPPRTALVGVLLATGRARATDRPLAVIDLQVLVGREDGCEVLLSSPRVSRRHARIWTDGDRFGVEDLGSLNGTYVNRHRVTGVAPLSDGDRLTLADVELQFRMLPAESAPTPEPPSGPMAYPQGATAVMPPAVDPAPPAPDDLRAVHLLAALLAALAGAVIGHLLGVGRTGALVLAVVLPLAAGALLLRPTGLRRALRVLVLAALAAVLTATGVTAAELRTGHAVLPGVASGGTFASAVQLDRLLGRPSPPSGCGPEPTVSVASTARRSQVVLRVNGECFGPGSSVELLVGPTVVTDARADRFGRLDHSLAVDPDASCPLGRCVVTAHELQSLRYQQTSTDVATAG